MPEGTLEVEVKVKTTWGKCTMIQNTHTRMEKYHTWEKAQRCHITSKKRRTPCKATSMHTEDTNSETDIPTDQEFEYPPQVFSDPTHTAVTTHTKSEDMVKQETKFLGRYCEYCHKGGETHCCCFSSDWEDGLLNVNDPNTKPSIETIPFPTANKPPVGWSEFRCTIIREKDQTRPPSQTADVSTDSGTSMQ